MSAATHPAVRTGPFGQPFPVVYVDGRFSAEEDSRVSVHANAISYGTGTFEGIRATWNEELGELYLLEAEAHFQRLQQSARVLGLDLAPSPQDLVAASSELLRRNGVRVDTYLRPLYILEGEELPVRMHDVRPRLSIAATPFVGAYISLSGVRCMISSWRRAPDAVLPSRAKLCGSYVGPALAKSEAVASGYDEAIMLNVAGNVTEATTSNLFMRRGTEWLTPAVSDDILEGITRAQVKTLLAERTGSPVLERSVQRTELFVSDEILLCGTAALIVPVVEVSGRPVGDGKPGETTMALQNDLRSIARRADGRHFEWTTPVYGTAEGKA